MTTADVHEIISKLSSDKMKTREEGTRLLNTWMEGDRCSELCKLLSKKTEMLKPDEVPQAETWPFLLSLLTKCISMEISISKKRPPKLLFARTLKNVVQRAEDARYSGYMPVLLSVMKSFFAHIWDVIRGVPSFQSEYGTILRQLLTIKEYRFQMKKSVYCGLVRFYTGKIATAMTEKIATHSHAKEEVFRLILTLYSLLESPPGDFPANLRDDVVMGFVSIFSHVRDEGKISRKLVECINVFLLHDGPNLGQLAMEVHCSLQDFMLHFWLSTHDLALKRAFICYAYIQLKLMRSPGDGNAMLEQLLDIVDKELDKCSVPVLSKPWDDKVEAVASVHRGLIELAASIFYQACAYTPKWPSAKRFKREHIAVRLKDALVHGKHLWCGAFYFLVRNYHSRISNTLLSYWFDGICGSFERILNEGNRLQSYDGIMWLLRSLQELLSLMVLKSSREVTLKSLCVTFPEASGGWHLIWSCLMHSLPQFCGITSVAHTALVLLGNIVLNGLVAVPIVPGDIWELHIFADALSAEALFFIACYFSRKSGQGDHDVLSLRQTLAKSVSSLLYTKDGVTLSDQLAMLIPAAIFSLCTGSIIFPSDLMDSLVFHPRIMAPEAGDRVIGEEHTKISAYNLFDCSVEVLAEIEHRLPYKAHCTLSHHNFHLPQHVRHSLVQDMGDYFLRAATDYRIHKLPLPDIFLFCTLLCNCIFSSFKARINEERPSFIEKMFQILLKLLEESVSVIQEMLNQSECGFFGAAKNFDLVSSSLGSVRCLMSSSIFIYWKTSESFWDSLFRNVIQVIHRLLIGLSKLYGEASSCSCSSDLVASEERNLLGGCCPANVGETRITDVELDIDVSGEDSHMVGDRKEVSGKFFLYLRLKLDIVSSLLGFFTILPDLTWDTLFKLLIKETDAKVRQVLLRCLCEKFTYSRVACLTELLNAMDSVIESSVDCKPYFFDLLCSVHCLLESLLPSHVRRKDEHLEISFQERVSKLDLSPFANLINKVADAGILDWAGRVKLINCICCFVSFDPCSAQEMVGRLMVMVQDIDFRVRLFLARRIGVLFQTWDGHHELFEDICSNFGVEIVMASKGKVVKASTVLAAGVQSRELMETAVVTLGHVAFLSEKVELEAVFMICAVAAFDPSLRELVCAILDNLSHQLHYFSRGKYVEELTASILACWVTCGVSLLALIEIRDLFESKAEPSSFMQYCCTWLLPLLLIYEKDSDLEWVSAVTSQPLKNLAKDYFVPIFAVCMGLHCSNSLQKQSASAVLQKSILHVAEIAEHERDKLIKKNMVSIVSCFLSLVSSSLDPSVPYLSEDTAALAIRTVVDGFLNVDDHTLCTGAVDKINIFRPDRVFMFLLQVHYEITAAAHPRHRCHRLSSVSVLINVIGHRALLPSTSCYLFSLTGQFIGNQHLLDQCCHMLTTLLDIFRNNACEEVTKVLGELLQFLVSKLVACCIPSEGEKDILTIRARVIPLLHQLLVDGASSLHDYIRELPPFPANDDFLKIKHFHEDISKSCSRRELFVKVIRKSCYMPEKLLSWRLQTLHRRFVEEIINSEKSTEHFDPLFNEPEIVSAVWSLLSRCRSIEMVDFRRIVADFIAMVGVGDPHQVVLHMPDESCQKYLVELYSHEPYNGVPHDLLIKLLWLIKKYLMDDSVVMVDMASKAAKGILCTEGGQRALKQLDSFERSLLMIHSTSANMDVVEKLLFHVEMNAKAKVIPLEDSSTWNTKGKTYEEWLCPLAFSLSTQCSDIVLRLCQELILLKAEVAELLFPIIFLDIAGENDTESDICRLISSQVEECLFTKSNHRMKTIQLMMDVLNVLRVCHVGSWPNISLASKRRHVKLSSPRNSSRARAVSGRYKALSPLTSAAFIAGTSLEKVYWLRIDYLVVAQFAVLCGSYFTALMYVEYWCEEHFGSLALGRSDFSAFDGANLPPHIELLIAAVTHINEPDSIYGIVQSHKLKLQAVTYEHEGNWSKALECYDLLIRTKVPQDGREFRTDCSEASSGGNNFPSYTRLEKVASSWNPYRGLLRSLQHTGCTHILDVYCQGMNSRKAFSQQDTEFHELQYEAAWRAGRWDFSLPGLEADTLTCDPDDWEVHFHENLHSCLRALKEGAWNEFHRKLMFTKEALVLSISCSTKESTEAIYLAILRLQILNHLDQAWHLRWRSDAFHITDTVGCYPKHYLEPAIPSLTEMERLNADWNCIMRKMQIHLNLLEPFIAFRHVLLQILSCKECTMQHLLQSASLLRKGSKFPLAAALLQELKLLTRSYEMEDATSDLRSLGMIEEAKLLWAQGQHDGAISLAKYILHHYELRSEAAHAYRLVGNWLAETRSSNSRTVVEQYLKYAVQLSEQCTSSDKKFIAVQCRCYFHLGHYTDALFRSYKERLASSEWQAAMQLRRHKAKELDALMKRVKMSSKGDRTDYAAKILELQKQLMIDKEEAERLEDDRDSFLILALESYQRCIAVGEKFDMRVVFRLVSLWFSLSSAINIVNSMLSVIKEVHSHKFLPLVYQIASRIGNPKDGQGSHSFHFALVSLVKKMAIDHPYHTIFLLLALANGDRVKDKQRNRNSFIADMDKKLAAENLLKELSSYHGTRIQQLTQMVEAYIKLAEFETRKEETNKRIVLPRDLRSLQPLELAPVVTAAIPIDYTCQYPEGSFPYFNGFTESVMVMNGINAPKVVECFGSDGCKYRQLAKSGNDDLRQDAVMEQFFGLVNNFLRNHRDTWKRQLKIRTYKVVPFTPTAGVLEWVDGTIPLGEYLLGSQRNGGAHAQYGTGDWTFSQCRECMANEKDKSKAFQRVCENFRPVMHYFFLERYLQPADWFEHRLFYTRSVAASSMVGYIVGLGDRHSNNILIDQATAEVVHIDLGVAFDQGLMLKTPERVPFRLTRDIVDGMGVTGVEGVFRRCSEETLSLMRVNKEALLTIIEVFIHDPLYKWALSPLKALQRQKEMDDETQSSTEDSQDAYEGNKDAARALLRVKQKLDGYEEGEIRSIQGQVQQLIQDAIDPERLCQMFPGWGAWL